MKQPDLYCQNCILSDCNESSVVCIYRLLTNPNKAQQAVVASVGKRKAYYADYYRQNKQRIKEREAKKYLERQCGHAVQPQIQVDSNQVR